MHFVLLSALNWVDHFVLIYFKGENGTKTDLHDWIFEAQWLNSGYWKLAPMLFQPKLSWVWHLMLHSSCHLVTRPCIIMTRAVQVERWHMLATDTIQRSGPRTTLTMDQLCEDAAYIPLTLYMLNCFGWTLQRKYCHFEEISITGCNDSWQLAVNLTTSGAASDDFD